MWSRFAALPAYFGGKRALCPVIFKEISRAIPRERWARTTLIDGFCGGGSVSLYAKAQGMRVISNDLADRSRVIMDSLIVNDRVTLADEDLHRLFANGQEHPRFVEEHFVPSMFMRKHALFIDRALAAIENVAHHTKRQLLRLALMRYMLAVTPYSQIHSVNYYRWLENEQYHRLGMSRMKKVPYTCLHPIRVLKPIPAQINRAVFPNGHRNEAHQQDVFELLGSAKAEVCYLDPPYAGAQPYEVFYGVLDQVLERRGQPRPTSPFNGDQAREFVMRLLDAAKRFPVVILSYGSQRYSLQEFTEMVHAVEPTAHIHQVNLRYAIGSKSEQESIRKELLAVITHG